MADSKNTHTCPLCGAPNATAAPGERCQSCGSKMSDSKRPSRHEELDRGYQQEGFSGPWCGISLAVVGIATSWLTTPPLAWFLAREA